MRKNDFNMMEKLIEMKRKKVGEVKKRITMKMVKNSHNLQNYNSSELRSS